MRTTEQTGAAPHADGPTVAIIVGSTRPGRKADTVAHWVHDIAAHRQGRHLRPCSGGFPADGGELT
jgi:NAD(P)H-dependent FMN reductase